MAHPYETWNQKADGERFWQLVPGGPLMVQSNQTAYRVFRDCFISTVVLMALLMWADVKGGQPGVAVTILFWVILLAVNSGSVWYYWTRERPLNPLAALIDDKAIHIGCAQDCLTIPWNAVDVTASKLPVNNSFMVVPVARTMLETILLETGETGVPWNRMPYRRTILTVKYNPEMSWIEIYSNPNGFFVNILQVVYPMLGIGYQRHNRPPSTD